jgi:hypothetical protein
VIEVSAAPGNVSVTSEDFVQVRQERQIALADLNFGSKVHLIRTELQLFWD